MVFSSSLGASDSGSNLVNCYPKKVIIPSAVLLHLSMESFSPLWSSRFPTYSMTCAAGTLGSWAIMMSSA
jgi:hypothetical protein